MAEENKKKQINIELSDEMAEGTYSNLAIITHPHSEFIVDFIKMMPGAPKAKVKSRIILTLHVKSQLQSNKSVLILLKKQHFRFNQTGEGNYLHLWKQVACPAFIISDKL